MIQNPLSEPPHLASVSPRRDWYFVIVFALLAVGMIALACRLLIPFTATVSLDLAAEAKDFLRVKKHEPLSGSLQALLADSTKPRVPSEPHPLLNRPAPQFNLSGVDGQIVKLEELLAKGPVVLVFYYGYSCNHCVSQLFDLNEDIRYFNELGATVVAISPDSGERTKVQYAKYGAFAFPVLSDKDRSIGSRYGVYRPAVGGDREWEAHGTFLIGRDGAIRWANIGPEPFSGNTTLLAEIARLENRLPGTNEK